MPRKTSKTTTARKASPVKATAKTSSARKTSPATARKTATAKKTTTAKSAPRRSGSMFTSPRDGLLVRDIRPTEIKVNARTGKYDVYLSGKKIGSTSSMSSARRLRYKAERTSGFKVTESKLAKLRNS